METGVFSQIKRTLEGSKKIAILPNPKKKEDSFASSLVLMSFLRKLNKDVSLIETNNYYSQQEPQLISNRNNKNNYFVLTLNKDISRIYYKKEGPKIKLYFTPKDQEILPEDFNFAPVVTSFSSFNTFRAVSQTDLLISLGFKNFQEIEDTLSEGEENFFFQAKIINIDNSQDNEKFGEINLVKPGLSLADIVDEILKEIKEPKNEFFKNNISLPIKNLRLFKKVIERFNYLEEIGIYFSYLKRADFEETMTDSLALKEVIEKIRKNFNSPDFLIFWESTFSNPEPRTFGVFYLKNEGLVKKISEKFLTQRKGRSGIFLIEKSDIESALKSFINSLK